MTTQRPSTRLPTRYLTGITTTGTPHLGNYVGSIRPSVAASLQPDVQSFYFLADYHGLIKCGDPARIQQSTLEIAASWLAAGLDPEKVTFYRQSDVPEVCELHWLLTCVAGKGLLNRAHAYKAATDKNAATGKDTDDGVTAGLFMYPVLMGADILLFKANKVPVGRDQVQHIEMARDMASSFNHLYGDHLVLPEAVVDDNVATLPGLDGRKMSKSYDNTIPLFSTSAQLRKLISSIVTDSRAPGEPKATEGSALFQIYQAFASAENTAKMQKAYADGIAWGEVKQQVVDELEQHLAPMRSRYTDLIANPAQIETTLLRGAERARAQATALMQQLRHAVGLRKLVSTPAAPPSADSSAQSLAAPNDALSLPPSFKQYRQANGQFHFKLVSHQGATLFESQGFTAPKEAGQAVSQLKQGAAHLPAWQSQLQLAPDVGWHDVEAALDTLALHEKAQQDKRR